MEERKLTAAEGMVLTNGREYGKVIYLGIYDTPDNWYEITEEEYAEKVREEAEAEMATEEDYRAALREMGVQV